MSITAYQQAPYFDDFVSAGNEAKNYLKILFRPGYSVQNRELNQLQSAIQSQIDKLGKSIYVDGTAVLGGATTFDKNLYYVDIDITDTVNPNLEANITKITRLQNASGILADVLKVVQLTDVPEPGDKHFRFYIRYASASQTGSGLSQVNVSIFAALSAINNSILVEDDLGDTAIGIGSPIGSVVSVGYAALVSVPSGVFFTKGCFVVSEAQNHFIDLTAQDELISGYAVFRVDESIVTYDDDISLLDNANGSPNYNARGANRYVITLTLDFLTASEIAASDDDYIRLLTVENSSNVSPARTEYTNLDRVMATRTFEESGNYTVRPFGLDIREMYNDELGNRGKYNEDQLDDLGYTIPEAEENYIAGIEPSVGYVGGYRIELQNRKDIIVPKARETAYASDVYFSARLGNYVLGNLALDGAYVDALPNVTDAAKTYSLYDVSNVLVGTVKIRGLEYVSTGSYRLFIYDVALESGKVLFDATYLKGNNFRFASPGSAGFELFDAGFSKSMFPLPYSTVKSLYPDGGVTPAIRYKVRKNYSAVAATPGLSMTGTAYELTIDAGTNYHFVDDTPSNYVVSISDVGMVVPSAVNIAVGGATATLEFTGPDPIGAKVITVHASVEALDVTQKTKTVATQNSTGVAYATLIELIKGDVIKINHVYVTSTTVDIQSEFVFDNGQRDYVYTNGSLKYIGSTDRSAQTFVINYDYFAHSGSGDYFSVDSYSALDYGDIPSYAGVRLSDVLDFRPMVLTGDTTVSTQPIDPNSVVVSDLNYYLPRIDKVILSDSGEFKVISGVSSLTPLAPSLTGNSMALYTLYVPAFTFEAADIEVTYIDNRRYTMRDIGTIEKRVTNLEYYTSLSLLEKEASGKQILDEAGGDRYKNGIIVDSFLGHNTGQVENPAYACAIDTQEGILRPSYESSNIRFVIDTIPVGLVVNTNTVTLDFTEEVLITQPFASLSMSVNPYDVASWAGVVDLSPSSDEWKSTVVAPDLVVNERGTYNAFKKLANKTNVLGTHWNEWETAWTGTQIQKSKPHSVVAPDGKARQQVTTTTKSLQIREGVRTTLSYKDVEKNIGESVIDISYVPFIRSRRVYFKASLLKPGTRVYPFFDGVNISAYATAASFVHFREGASVKVYDNVLPGALGYAASALITDETGEIEGYFTVPNNTSLRFRTGDREFKLTDSPTNDNEEATTSAEFVYNASGLLETVQSTILSTRVAQLDKTRVAKTKTTSKTAVKYVDPLAQSFVIGDIASGIYATSVDLFFSKKSSKNIPIILTIVSVENGIPTQNTVPFSTVILNDVEISDTAATPTNFAFSDPVYLQAGVEYALVVRSNDSDYRLWVSEIGGRDVASGQLISKNPYAGVMFKSQNASTWTPEQTMDLKFTINRAEFAVNTPVALTLEKAFDEDVLPIQLSTFTTILEQMVLPDTSIDYTLSALGTELGILPNQNYDLAAQIEFDNVADNLQLVATLATENNCITPVLDLDRLSLLGVKNIVNNLTTNEATRDGGSALARYLTNQVDLNDPAEHINIYTLVNRPSDEANVDVYVKIKTDDSVLFENLPWTLINPETTIPVSSDPTAFNEIQYIFNSEDVPFTSFAIKMVLRSSNPAAVPTLKDFRAIATT